MAADEPPWKVQEGGNEAEGFFVIGYGPDPALPSIPYAPHLFGPYSLEDALAVVAARDPTVRPLDEEALRREQAEIAEAMRYLDEQEQSPPPGMNVPPPPESGEGTDAAEPALWETETTEDGLEVVWLNDENWNRARDYVVNRLEGAGIQVGEVRRWNLGEGDKMAIEFRGEAAVISAPKVTLVEEIGCLSFTGKPEPENLRVELFFGPPTEDSQFNPHRYAVVGTVRDIIALIQY